MAPKQDKRIIRTRKQLQGALLQLIEEKPYELITIMEIAAVADVSRATFYLHYRDKNELFIAVAGDKLQLLAAQLSSANLQLAINDTSLSIKLFKILEADFKLYKILFHHKETRAFYPKIEQLFAEAIRQLLVDVSTEEELGQLRLAPDLLYTYVASGTIVIINWWLENDMPESAEYMADMSRRLSLSGILPFLMGSEGPNI